MNRRTLLSALLFAPLAVTLRSPVATARTSADLARMRERWADLLPAGFSPPDPGAVVSRSEEEWRRQLSPAAFHVMRQEGTERAFTSPLNDEERKGVFLCAGCDLPLFTSQMKYDSGTGWPSFFTHIPGAFGTRQDFKLFGPRTEYHCVRCGGHQGHVFGDGPPPTRERWCNNGVALRFLATDGPGH